MITRSVATRISTISLVAVLFLLCGCVTRMEFVEPKHAADTSSGGKSTIGRFDFERIPERVDFAVPFMPYGQDRLYGTLLRFSTSILK